MPSVSNDLPPHVKNITGLESGRLVVLSFCRLNSKGKSMWRCLCETRLGGCGNKTIVLGQYLTSNRTKSCGCLQGKAGK